MLLYRTILLLAGAGGMITAILLLFLLAMSWSTSQRIGPISDHLSACVALQSLYTDLIERRLSPRSLNEEEARPPDRTVQRLRRVADEAAFRVPQSPEVLRRAAELFDAPAQQVAGDGLTSAIGVIGGALSREAEAHRLLLAEIDDHSRHELHAAIALGIVLPGFVLGFATFFRRRILAPLNDLSRFLGLLARKDYALAGTEHVDPLVRPLFEKYNRMVRRMRDLEEEHIKREESLQQDVDQATRALFQQQAALSRMERLAAVGEFSARLGHELRNPISGVLMALTNLRDEVASRDQDERLALAIGELERIAHRLSSIVDESRQVPERPRPVHLGTLVGGLVSLARYQLDDGIRLSFDVPEDMRCTLPEAGLRHALLNLVLNAAAALAGRTGTIRIAAKSTADAVAISVSDDGPGFPDDLLSIGIHDFGSWRRSGTGLGLAAVRRFAHANSGQVALQNPSGGGACVTLRFPLGKDGG